MIKRLESLKNTVNKYMADNQIDLRPVSQNVSRRPSVSLYSALKIHHVFLF
jgi:hypothetical protein